MSDWQVGDLGVAVGGTCEFCIDDADPRMVTGRYYTVTGIIPNWQPGGPVGFDLAEAPIVPDDEPWCSCGFRKVRPCDPDFITLLKRAKRPVSA